MTIPLPNPWITSETVLIIIVLFFFALWGWRHGLDATLIWLLFVVVALWATPELAAPLGKIVNAVLGLVRLMMSGQFSMDNWSAAINGQSQVVEVPVDVQNPDSSSMQLMTLLTFAAITFIGFRYALKKAGGKDRAIASFFGAVGSIVVGYLVTRFMLDTMFSFPQTVEITPSEYPPLEVNATVLLLIVLVLVVYGVLRSEKKPPPKKD